MYCMNHTYSGGQVHEMISVQVKHLEGGHAKEGGWDALQHVVKQ